METNDLRKKSLKAIDDVHWIPAKGKNRIRAMVDSRPDWVVSRQRAWGVPLTIFINKNGEEFARVIGSINFEDEQMIEWLQKFD